MYIKTPSIRKPAAAANPIPALAPVEREDDLEAGDSVLYLNLWETVLRTLSLSLSLLIQQLWSQKKWRQIGC